MKEHPILFSAAMVRAILDGTKTQTRRLVKLPTGFERIDRVYPIGDGWRIDESNPHGIARQVTCPYGVPGDRLWVKEAITRDIYADTSHFRADSAPTKADAWPWKRRMLPGMFMPKGLRRITLELIDVRVERLQDISEKDARAEGCIASEGTHGTCDARTRYSELWDRINGPGAWDLNPWVWALTFKRMKP